MRLAGLGTHIQKWPFHWSICRLDRVLGAPTKSDGQEREKACGSRVRWSQSCTNQAGTPSRSVSAGSLSGMEQSYR